MYVHTHVHICIHIHTHVCTYTHTHTYTRTHTCTYIHAHTHICTYTHTHVQSCERHMHVFISTTVLTPVFCSPFSRTKIRHRPKRTGHRRRRMTWCRVLETRVSSEPTAHNLLLGPAVTTDCEIPRVQSRRLLTQSDCGSDRW